MEDYFKIDAVSQSSLKKWLLGKNFAEIEKEETKAMTAGSIFHALMAGDHEEYAIFNEDEILATLTENANPRATKAYKQFVAEFSEKNQGKYIIDKNVYEEYCKMRDILYRDETISKIINLSGSSSETPFLLENFNICGTILPLVKGKADLTVYNDDLKQYWILDWKKTARVPTPHNIRRLIMYELNIDFQAAWYTSLYIAKYGVTPNLLWVFIMDKEPYEYLIVDMSDFLESGYQKIEKAIFNMQTGQSFRTMYGDEYGICRLKRDWEIMEE